MLRKCYQKHKGKTFLNNKVIIKNLLILCFVYKSIMNKQISIGNWDRPSLKLKVAQPGLAWSSAVLPAGLSSVEDLELNPGHREDGLDQSSSQRSRAFPPFLQLTTEHPAVNVRYLVELC